MSPPPSGRRKGKKDSQTRNDLLKLIEKKGQVSTSEASKELDLVRNRVQTIVKSMIEDGSITSYKKGRQRYYEIAEDKFHEGVHEAKREIHALQKSINELNREIRIAENQALLQEREEWVKKPAPPRRKTAVEDMRRIEEAWRVEEERIRGKGRSRILLGERDVGKIRRAEERRISRMSKEERIENELERLRKHLGAKKVRGTKFETNRDERIRVAMRNIIDQGAIPTTSSVRVEISRIWSGAIPKGKHIAETMEGLWGDFEFTLSLKERRESRSLALLAKPEPPAKVGARAGIDGMIRSTIDELVERGVHGIESSTVKQIIGRDVKVSERKIKSEINNYRADQAGRRAQTIKVRVRNVFTENRGKVMNIDKLIRNLRTKGGLSLPNIQSYFVDLPSKIGRNEIIMTVRELEHEAGKKLIVGESDFIRPEGKVEIEPSEGETYLQHLQRLGEARVEKLGGRLGPSPRVIVRSSGVPRGLIEPLPEGKHYPKGEGIGRKQYPLRDTSGKMIGRRLTSAGRELMWLEEKEGGEREAMVLEGLKAVAEHAMPDQKYFVYHIESSQPGIIYNTITVDGQRYARSLIPVPKAKQLARGKRLGEEFILERKEVERTETDIVTMRVERKFRVIEIDGEPMAVPLPGGPKTVELKRTKKGKKKRR